MCKLRGNISVNVVDHLGWRKHLLVHFVLRYHCFPFFFLYISINIVSFLDNLSLLISKKWHTQHLTLKQYVRNSWVCRGGFPIIGSPTSQNHTIHIKEQLSICPVSIRRCENIPGFHGTKWFSQFPPPHRDVAHTGLVSWLERSSFSLEDVASRGIEGVFTQSVGLCSSGTICSGGYGGWVFLSVCPLVAVDFVPVLSVHLVPGSLGGGGTVGCWWCFSRKVFSSTWTSRLSGEQTSCI